MSINYRFWPDWPCPAAIKDVQRAVRWLRRHAAEYRIDPNRFGGIGSSAGSHLCSHLALVEGKPDTEGDLAGFSNKLQCVVDICGPVDLIAMMRSASAPIVEGFMGRPLEGAEEDYRLASPYHLIRPNPPPFLIVHGTADTGEAGGQVPIGISERFAERLRAAGGDATFLPLEGATHGLANDPASVHAKRMWQAAIAFFERRLLGAGAQL